MWWLKWVLGYCVFAVVGLWFGYRSRAVLPGHDSGFKAGYDPGRTRDTQEPGTRGQPRSL